jgi:hypothetical protein
MKLWLCIILWKLEGSGIVCVAVELCLCESGASCKSNVCLFDYQDIYSTLYKGSKAWRKVIEAMQCVSVSYQSYQNGAVSNRHGDGERRCGELGVGGDSESVNL